MQIQVIGVSKPEWKEGKVNAQTGKASKYQEVVLTYTAGGKTSVKKVMSFAPIFNAVKEAEGGEQYDVEMIKEGEFWNWKGMVKLDGSAVTTSTSGDMPKAQMTRPNTYETAEERAKKQVYIIRQSSLTNAINLLAANGGKKNSVEEVIQTADQFVQFVLGETTPTVFDMEDDIPS